jgi:hypothetical protein
MFRFRLMEQCLPRHHRNARSVPVIPRLAFLMPRRPYCEQRLVIGAESELKIVFTGCYKVRTNSKRVRNLQHETLRDKTKHFATFNNIPAFLVDPKVTSPSRHRILITETFDKKLRVQHDDKGVIVDVTTPPPPRRNLRKK